MVKRLNNHVIIAFISHPFRLSIVVRKRRLIYLGCKRTESEFVRFHLARHAHRHVCASVESAGKRNDGLTLRIFSGDFHGVFYGFRTRVQENRFFSWAPGASRKAFRQFQIGRIHHDVKTGMDELFGLPLDSFYNFPM